MFGFYATPLENEKMRIIVELTLSLMKYSLHPQLVEFPL